MPELNTAELRRLEAEADKVKRYAPSIGRTLSGMTEKPEGDYVRYADYLAMRNALPELLKVVEWHDMSTAPKDGTVINAVARYPNATAGFPRYIAWLDAFGSEGAWFEMSCNAPERVIPWAWRPRGVWPSEPRGGVDVG